MNNIPFNIIKAKYLDYFTAVAIKSAINPIALLKLSYDLTANNQKLLKNNNFFAVMPKNGKVFNKYSTPFEGINAGLEIIKSHPEYNRSKVGTLKANENLQYLKLKNLLKL
jgi:hypothetical protein